MMRHGHSARAAILVAAGVVLGVSASAQAGLTGSPLSITATNSRGSVTWNMPSNWLRTRETSLGTEWYYEGNLSWRGENDSGQLVWGFNPDQLMTVSFIEDPQISLN